MAHLSNKSLTILFSMILALAVCACQPNTKLSINSQPPDIIALINQLPASDSTTAELITQELLGQAPDSFEHIFRLIIDGNKDQRVQAEYAIAMLTAYFGKDPAHPLNQTYIKSLENVLQTADKYDDRQFFIEQLAHCGQESSLQYLHTFLLDDTMWQPAHSAMVSIDPEKTNMLLVKDLENLPDEVRIAAINQLGNHKYIAAAPDLMAYTGSENRELRASAAVRLAKMGYEPVEKTLRSYMRNPENNGAYDWPDVFVTWIENLSESARQTNLINEVITDTAGHIKKHHKLRLFYLCCQNQCDDVYVYLEKFLDDPDPEIRREALRMTHKIPGNEMTAWLISHAKQDKYISEVVMTLGERGDSSATKYLDSLLYDSVPEIKQAAMHALRRLDSVAALFAYLVTADSLSSVLLTKELKYAESEDLHAGIQASLAKPLTRYAKMCLLHVIAQRQLVDYGDFVRTSLRDADSDVRITAMMASGELSDISAVAVISKRLTHIQGEKERSAAFACLTKLLRNHADVERYLYEIHQAEQEKSNMYNEHFYKLLAGIGGPVAFEILQSELRVASAQTKTELMDYLFTWPDGMALDTLYLLAAESSEKRHRIKAVRAILRILRQNDYSDYTKINWYQQLMTIAPRPQDKIAIVADAAAVKSKTGLDFLLGVKNDPEVSTAVSIALLESLEHPNQANQAYYLARQLILENASPEILSLVADDKGEPELNQPPEGFTALFNGIDLTGWQGLVLDPVKRRNLSSKERDSLQHIADDVMRSHWYVDRGILYFDGKGANLCTIKEYQNFELYLDWKIEKGGDSGIYLRSMPQVQIKDQHLPMGGSGGLYNNKINENRPLEIADREPGHWNRFHIIMVGKKVTVYLNNRLVVDNVTLENYWERDKPAYSAGPIELQAHFSPLAFKNIFIRELPPAIPKDQYLFNGNDLSNWQPVNTTADDWSVADGVLATPDSGWGWLATKDTYSDFELSLEFKVSPGGNSGIFLRAPQTGDPAFTGMEIQILDNFSEKYSGPQSWQYCGSIYGVYVADKHAALSADQWQQLYIVCDGPEVKVELNGKKVVETNLAEHMFLEARHPGLKRRAGHIGLQAHGSKVEFRNIWLKEL